MNNSIKVLVGFAAGALAGLLLTPNSGPTNRKKLSVESDKLRDSLSKSVAEAFDAAKNKYNTMIGEYTKAAKDTANKAQYTAEKTKVDLS